MQLEAGIARVWRCIWRPRSRELRDALGGHARLRLEKYLEVVDLEVMEVKAVNLKAVGREACVKEPQTPFVG